MSKYDYDLVLKYFPENPRLIIAIGVHETGWGKLGWGRSGFHLGYGCYTANESDSRFKGLENQLKYGGNQIKKYLGNKVYNPDKIDIQNFGYNSWKPGRWENGHYINTGKEWGTSVYNIYISLIDDYKKGDEEKLPEYKNSIFKDVNPDSWAYNAIKYCSEMGLVSGFEDGTFRPGEALTREQFCMIKLKEKFINGLWEKDIVQKVIASTVLVIQDNGMGSGFCFKTDNEYSYIITNSHVVGEDKTFSLIKDNGDMPYTGELVRKDETKDLAIIRTKTKLPVLSFSTDITQGQPVLVVGAPQGHTESITAGIISSTKRSNLATGTKWIQIDAAINPGNSGGAVVNEKGEVIGVAVAKYTAVNVEGIGYCIKSEEILKFI